MEKLRLVDSHCHLHGGYEGLDAFFAATDALMDGAGLEKVNVAMAPQWDDEYITQNPLGILYKALFPAKVYAYAGLDCYLPGGEEPKPPLEQLMEAMDMGFDGLKMVELKPTVQRHLGHVQISSPKYEALFSHMEARGIPLLLHVGDPETFWTRENCPAFALQKGWCYENGDYASKEALYRDAEAVLERHPGLHASLAHFYFLSDDPERAAAVLDKYPNVCFDLTPGTEMYGNFAKLPGVWHDFFEAYANRIMLGTDNGGLSADGFTPMQEKIAYARDNVANIVRFLSTRDNFEGYGMRLQGIGVSEAAQRKILSANFEALAGKAPRPINVERALRYTDRLLKAYRGADMPRIGLSLPLLEEIRRRLANLL